MQGSRWALLPLLQAGLGAQRAGAPLFEPLFEPLAVPGSGFGASGKIHPWVCCASGRAVLETPLVCRPPPYSCPPPSQAEAWGLVGCVWWQLGPWRGWARPGSCWGGGGVQSSHALSHCFRVFKGCSVPSTLTLHPTASGRMRALLIAGLSHRHAFTPIPSGLTMPYTAPSPPEGVEPPCLFIIMGFITLLFPLQFAK